MDKSLIEKYKSDMLDMYRAIRADAAPIIAEQTEQKQPAEKGSTGGLIAIVTALREIYPVKNAKVTIFTGNIDNMQIISTALTDESGRTPVFVLPTPPKSVSFEENSTVTPYSVYNMLVSAEGYLDNVHINIPVFSGVTSLQSSSMTLLETAGDNKNPQIFDESQRFDL